MIKSKERTDRRVIAAVGIAGLVGIIVTTMINMGFLAQSETMSNPVFFISAILILNAVIVVGITVGTARWIYLKL